MFELLYEGRFIFNHSLCYSNLQESKDVNEQPKSLGIRFMVGYRTKIHIDRRPVGQHSTNRHLSSTAR